MMRNEYPEKRKGDSLEASHVNKLSGSSAKFERMTPGSFMGMMHTGSTVSFSGSEPFHVYGAAVSNKLVCDTDTEDSGLYLIQLKWYSFDRGEWIVDADKDWILDTRIDGGPLELEVGENIRVYWDFQRGAFVLSSFGLCLRICDLTEDLLSGSTATANLRAGRSLSEEGGEIIVNDLAVAITAGKKINYGTGCWVFRDSRMNLDLADNEYVFLIPIACEATA